MLIPEKIETAADKEALLRAFSQITGGYTLKRFSLMDIFCEGETVENGQTLNGETAFFRHFRITCYLLDLLKSEGAQNRALKVLTAPSSIGCEPYSFATMALSRNFTNVTVHGLDRSAMFTQVARLGHYPNILVRHLENWGKGLFDQHDKENRTLHLVPVNEEVAKCVSFLRPGKFQDFQAMDKYDIVMVNNLFQYLSKEDLSAVLDKLVEMKPYLIAFTKRTKENGNINLIPGYASLEEHPFYKEEEESPFAEGPPLLKDYGCWFRECAPS